MEEVTNTTSFPSMITVTSYNDWPYSRIREINGTYIGEGIAFQLLEVLARKLNFKYTVIQPERETMGDLKHGLIRMLNRSEVDMAVAFLPILSELRETIEFSTPIHQSDVTFLMKRPPTSSTGSGLLAPFQDEVWIFIFISLLFVGPVIYFLIFLRSRFSNEDTTERYTFMGCMWFVYGALLKQGTTVSPIGDSTRLIFSTWWIFITILTAFYTANLTAFLTLSKYTLGTNSLQALVDNGYSWFIINGRMIHTLIEYNYPETQILKDSKKWGYGHYSYEYDMTLPQILKKARDGKVYIVERALAQMAIAEDYKNKTRAKINQERRCTYVISEKNVLARDRGFGFPVNSTIRALIDRELIAAVECGLIKHYVVEKLPLAKICPLNLKSKERKLKVSDLVMTYKVVFSGMGVAVVIFILELLSRLVRKFMKMKWSCSCCRTGEISGTNPPPIEHITQSWASPSKKPNGNNWIRTPPPVYQFNDSPKTYVINGRDYYVIKEETGDQRLVPIRTPSAYLFNNYIRPY